MKGLEGKKIVITRPAERAQDSVEMVKILRCNSNCNPYN